MKRAVLYILLPLHTHACCVCILYVCCTQGLGLFCAWDFSLYACTSLLFLHTCLHTPASLSTMPALHGLDTSWTKDSFFCTALHFPAPSLPVFSPAYHHHLQRETHHTLYGVCSLLFFSSSHISLWLSHLTPHTPHTSYVSPHYSPPYTIISSLFSHTHLLSGTLFLSSVNWSLSPLCLYSLWPEKADQDEDFLEQGLTSSPSLPSLPSPLLTCLLPGTSLSRVEEQEQTDRHALPYLAPFSLPLPHPSLMSLLNRHV